MMCQVFIWLWLGLTPTCEDWTEDSYSCRVRTQPTTCPMTAILDAESRSLLITGPNDVAIFDFPIQEPGWKRFEWREGGELAHLEGMGWRRRT